MNKNKIIFVSLWIFLITLIGLILWNQYQKKQNQADQTSNYHNWLEKPEKEINKYQFIFRQKEESIAKEESYFPKESIFIKRISQLKNGSIRNYLNILWPQWNKYYEIETKTLQQKIKSKNIIPFKIKEYMKKRFLREAFNYEILNKLNINQNNLTVSKSIIAKLLIMVRNKKNCWTKVVFFLEDNFQNKNAKIIAEKIKNSTWKFEWNDFLPEVC